MTQGLVFGLCLLGLLGLMLGMPEHFAFVTRATLGTPLRRVLRAVGWLGLGLAALLAVRQWAWGVGLVVWLGWLSVAGLALVFCRPYWPWQARPAPRPLGRRARAQADAALSAPLPHPRPLWRQAAIGACMLLGLVVVLAQYRATPVQPLLRADAWQGRIGPWEYTLAEVNTDAPEVQALQLGIKEFLLRFCERCDAEISMAYLKVRQPRTLRSAGMAFSGGRERYIELAIPPRATLDDGLWLTVVSKQGQVFEQRLAFEQVSPALAAFIQEQP